MSTHVGNGDAAGTGQTVTKCVTLTVTVHGSLQNTQSVGATSPRTWVLGLIGARCANGPSTHHATRQLRQTSEAYRDHGRNADCA